MKHIAPLETVVQRRFLIGRAENCRFTVSFRGSRGESFPLRYAMFSGPADAGATNPVGRGIDRGGERIIRGRVSLVGRKIILVREGRWDTPLWPARFDRLDRADAWRKHFRRLFAGTHHR